MEVDDADHLHAGVAGRHPRHGVARAAAAADAAAVGGRAAAAAAIPAAAGPVMGKYFFQMPSILSYGINNISINL